MPPPVPPSEALLKHAGFVRALAFAALRGDAESEDVAQDAWVAALEHAPREGERLRPWFVRVVRNRAAELLRLRGRRARRERIAAESRPAPPSTADLAEQAETGRRLVGAVLALEEPFKSAILLRFHEDLPPREVAQRLGVPVETVRSRVRRGLERLRLSMAQGARPYGSDWRAALVPLVPGGAIAGTSAATAGALAAGGVVVKKFAIAALLLVLVSGGAWLVWGSGGRSEEERDTRLLRADAPQADETARQPMAGAPSLEGNAPSARGSTPAGQPESTPLPANAIRGVVVDEAGKPVLGAVVRVVERGRSNWLHGRTEARPEPSPFGPVTTDTEGQFAFRQPENRFYSGLELRASAPGRVQRGQARGVHARPGEGVRLTLVPGVLVNVEVVDEQRGAPVAGAIVEAYKGGGYVLHSEEPVLEERTDPQGRVQLTLEPGEASFVARAPGRGFAVSRAVDVALPAHDVQLALRPAGSVEGVVLLPDGRPGAGLQVLMLKYPSESRTAVSDDTGRFRFDDVPSDDSRALDSKGQRILAFSVGAAGKFSQWFTADPPLPGETRNVRLQLVAGRTLSGTVRHRDGSPAAGVDWSYAAEVGAVEWGWTSRAGKAKQTTGPEGQFRIADLPPGRVLLAFGTMDPADGGIPVVIPVDADPPPLELILEDDSFAVTVLVLDSEGRPVANAHVALLGPKVVGKAPRATTTTDGTARLPFHGKPPWEVSVEGDRIAPAFAAVPERPAGDPAKPDVVVRLGSGVLEGRVLHLDGRPADVRLHLSLPGRTGVREIESSGRTGNRASDAEGRFRFTGVAKGSFGIRSATWGLRVVEEHAEFRAGQEGIEIHVATAAEAIALTLTVDVIDAADQRGLTSGVFLEARSAMGAGVIAFSPDLTAGMFTAARLAQPGTWTIRASRDGYEPAEATVDVTTTAAVPRVRLALRRR